MLRIKDTSNTKIKNQLLRWYNAASEGQKESGKSWYSEAQQFTQELAEKYGINPYTVAAVVSALSPNNKWERNKIDAINTIECFQNGGTANDIKVCTYSNNKNKAFNLLRLDGFIQDVSPKTHAFAMNIGMLSGSHVTVDKWHLRACLCHPNDAIKKTQESVTPKLYRHIERLTSEIAEKLNMPAYEFQAIVWVTIKDNWASKNVRFKT